MPARSTTGRTRDYNGEVYRSGARTHYIGWKEPASGKPGDLWTPMPAPRPVIIDTDFFTDVEDACALRVAVNYERAGYIDIRGVTINVTSDFLPGCVDALLTQSGHPGCPIGRSTTTHVPSGSSAFDKLWTDYPHTEGLNATAESSVTLMRRILAASDHRVDIISIGYLNNLEDLLDTPADSYSDLTGLELINQKVGTLWVMGGAWPTGTEYNLSNTTLAKTAANEVCAQWPRPIVFLGFEVGQRTFVGGGLADDTINDPITNILADGGKSYGRSAWDSQLTRLACIGDIEDAGYTYVQGTAAVNASTGANSWTTSSTGPHKYVVEVAGNRSTIERELELMVKPDVVTSVAELGEHGTKVMVEGNWVVADPGFRQLGGTTVTKARVGSSNYRTGLLMHLHADDLADLSNGDLVAHWFCRERNLPVRQPTSTNRPAYATNAGGKTAVDFSSSKWLYSDPVEVPRECSVYAYVYFTSLPGTAASVVVAESVALPAAVSRGWHLRMNNTGVPNGVTFQGGTGYSDAGPAISNTTWGVVSMRIDPAALTVEAFTNGTGSGGATSITEPNQCRIPIAIGSRYWTVSSAPLTGWIREVRVYDRFHDNSTMAAVVAEMTT